MIRLLGALCVLALAGSAFAAPFQNGSFEQGPATLNQPCYASDVTGSAIPGWTVSIGNVDWATTYPCNWNASDGAHSLDLIGSGSIGGVQQTFDTASNAWYRVTFDLAGNPDPNFPPSNKLLDAIVHDVSVDETHSYGFETGANALAGTPAKDGQNMGWVTHAFSFRAQSASTTLEFRSSTTGTHAGAALDNVRVTQLNPPGGPWVGSGSATNGSTHVNEPSFPTAALDGTTGPAIFTYGTVNSFCCHTGTWAFETTAQTASSNPLSLDWAYAGYHGTCQASVTLTGYVRRNGSEIVTTPLYSPAGNGNCQALPPSGGFDAQGIWTFTPPGGLQAGDTYGFRMTANNFDSNGAVSGRLEVSATTPVLSVPGAPTIGTATRGNAAATIAFTPPSSNGGSPITLYTATSSPGGISGTCTAPCTSIPVNGLTNGTAYTFTVRATNGIGPGPASLASNSVTPATVPGAPVIGTVTLPSGSSTATVTWTPPANGGSPITGYAIIGNGGTVTASAPGTATSTLVGGLQFGSSYSFTVQAINDVGTGPASAASTLTVALATPPSLIRAIEASSGTDATIVGRVDGAPSGALVQAYAAGNCTNGSPGGAFTRIGSPVAPKADGYVVITTSGVASAQFVTLQLVNNASTQPTVLSGYSACLPALADNDFWTTALLIGADNPNGATTTVTDYVDAPGKARWYVIRIAPGQQISVTLAGGDSSSLPADFDLAVFKDIDTAFQAQLKVTDTTDLTKLSAEYAPSTFSPSTFSPSTFSPSTFSPSTFSPDAFAPSTFSPSTFSPSTFSPSTFSPSTFSPSTFSPSTFSPSTFSPSTFSPSTFSPSTFSPSTFSPDVIGTAFSSAQTRSLIGVSATAGTVGESVVVDSWNNTGYFYVRVTGRNGAFSSEKPFKVIATKTASSCSSVSLQTLVAPTGTAPTGIQTVILTDTSSFRANAADVATMSQSLATLAGGTSGAVIDAGAATQPSALAAWAARVGELKTQAVANPGCPFAMNLVAEQVKLAVDWYRQANAGLRFIVIAGGDDVIPFFRYPDQSMLGQESDYVPPVTGASDASLRGNYVLSQDAYGSKTRISLRSSDYPVPGLAVGRLVKTPKEIAGMIEAGLPYLTTTATPGELKPVSSLVTGYDFLADAAGRVSQELAAGTGGTPEELIAPNNISPKDPAAWKASQLATKLFGARHDVVFLAGHFSANSTLAADFATNLLTSDLASSTTDFTNSIVFSAGCHSGYGIVDRDALDGVTFTLDWAQAFAQKKATLIAGTGYQYGDTDFIEYSERLYLEFARELRAGTGAVAIGEALVRAKVDYLAATPDIRGIHTKALLESTLYGLPMLGVNMPNAAGRGGPAGGSFQPVITPESVTDATLPAASLGLAIKNLSLNPAATPHTLQLYIDSKSTTGPLASYLEGGDGVVSNPSEPVLPLAVVNVTPTSATVLRGVGFRGGSYTDSNIVPLTGAPATEIRGVHVPFAAPNFFPNRPWTVNYFGALAGNGATSLLVTAAQHRGADYGADGFLRSKRRQFTGLDLRLYYSGNTTQASLSDAPSIVTVDARAQSPNVLFRAQVTGDPAAAIHEVWVVYTDGGGQWVPVDLKQCVATTSKPLPVDCGTTVDSQVWMRSWPISGSAIQYIVQAASGMGQVAFDDNRGAYYALSLDSTAPPSTTQQAAIAAPTTLTIESAPQSAAYGDSVSVQVRLTSNGTAVQSGLVAVNVGGFGNSGLTDANGALTLQATVSSPPSDPASVPITASYAGSASQLLPSTAATSFVVTKPAVKLDALGSGVGVRVTAPVVTAGTTTYQPVTAQAVSYVFTSTTDAKTIVVSTDANGNATVPTAGLPAGTYAVTASFLPAAVAGKETYYAGASKPLAEFVMKSQALAFTGVPATPVNAPDGAFTIGATMHGDSAALPITITSTTPDVCTVTGQPAPGQVSVTATILQGDADCQLSADVPGNANYAPAHIATAVTIAKAAQTIASFTGPGASITYAPPGTFTATATATTPNSGQRLSIASNTTGICTVAGTPAAGSVTYTVTIASAGSNCTLRASLPGNEFYKPTYLDLTVGIAKATQAITITGLSSDCSAPVKKYGNAPFAIGVTGGGSSHAVELAGTSGVCSVARSTTGTSVSISGAGKCSVTATQLGDELYLAAPPVQQCFMVNKASQTIDNFAAIPATKTFGDKPFSVSANATSSVGITVTLSAAGQCTLADQAVDGTLVKATVTLLHVGPCTITATALGDGNYDTVAPAQSFNILGTPQTIAFAALPDRTLGAAASYALSARASSGLPVSFAVHDTSNVCEVRTVPNVTPVQQVLRVLAPGECRVIASQSGTGSDYAAAPDVVQSFKVHLAGLVGLTGVTLGSNGYVDSFDSTPAANGGYAATKSANANIVSNGTINLQGDVSGNLESTLVNVVVSAGSLVSGNATAGTTVTTAGQVGGVTTSGQLMPAIAAPAVAACGPFSAAGMSGNYTYNATKGDLSVTGQNTLVLAAGTYCFNSITVSGGATLTASGPVSIALTGTLNASGNGRINSTLIPRNFQIASSYAGSNGVSLSGNATGYFTLYAPSTGITLSGNAQVYGSLLGKSFAASGNGEVHYDVKTVDVWDALFRF